MATRVLEFIRDPSGVWSLPAEQLTRLRRDFPEVVFDGPADKDAIAALLPEADVVFGWAVRAENFELARRLRWIHVSAAGVGPLLFPAFIESEVMLTNGRGLHAVSMAEHALGMMLAFARDLHVSRDAQRERRWIQADLVRNGPPLGELKGGTLAIVGLGRVGSAIAERARAFGLHVIGLRRRPQTPPEPAHEQWGPDRLLEALERADWVVLAAALTGETRRIIGRAELERMKPGAVLVNLGRGALVDEQALIDALNGGRLAGAALDVTEEEPLPSSSVLWAMPNVIVTPHISGYGPRYWARAVDQFAANLRRFLRGERLENLVDKRAGY